MKVNSFRRKGFTLVELLVAVAITTVIVTLLVYITSIAMTSWQRSRAEVRASSQGKAMVDSMARDFESLVTLRGNTFEWLFAQANNNPPGPQDSPSSAAADLIFFTSATDRYDGKLGTAADLGGDVSAVTYRLDYRDPVTRGGSNGENDTFALYRLLLNPDVTFRDVLGKEQLKPAFASYDQRITELQNYVCENVYQFTVTFNVVADKKTQQATERIVIPLTLSSTSGSQSVNQFSVKGDGLYTSYSGSLVTQDELKAGRIGSVQISLTVLSDFAIEQMRVRKFSDEQRAKFLNEHSYQFTKLVEIPGA